MRERPDGSHQLLGLHQGHRSDVASAAGVPSVAVSWGVHATDVLEGRSPSALVNTMTELEAELNRRFTGA